MKVVNLTPHDIDVIRDGRVLMSIPRSGVVARLVETVEEAPPLTTDLGTIPATTVRYGRPADLPEPTPGTRFLVSRVLAAAVARPDLCFPSGEVRDPGGRIIGCTSLGCFPVPVSPAPHAAGPHDA